MSETRYVSADFTSGWIAGRDWQRDHGASAQLDAARAALEEVRRYALAVVGASEAYGETESAHLWNEVAVIAEKALWPNIAALPSPGEGACVLHEWTVDYRACRRCGKVGEPDDGGDGKGE